VLARFGKHWATTRSPDGCASILRRPFDAINHQDLDGALRRLELQTELFLDCDEEVRRVRIGRRRVRSGASAWVAKVSSQSQLPARLARSMTYRPDGPMNAFTSAEGNHLLTFYRSSATVA